MESLINMRRILKVSVLGFAAGVVGACHPDEVIPTENIPTAGVRFINAVPDTMNLDFRFVDFVESNAHFRIPFRNSPTVSGTGAALTVVSTQVQYKNARAGSRRYKLFLNDTLQAVASTELVSATGNNSCRILANTGTGPATATTCGTLDLTAGSLYTVIAWGWAAPNDANVLRPPGSPPLTVDVFEEAVTVPANQVMLRVINATRSDIDWRTYTCSTGTPCVASPVPAAAIGTIPAKTVGPFVAAAPDTTVFNIRPVGGAAGTELFTDVRAMVGVPANASGARNPTTGVLLPCGGAGQLKCDIEAVPGTTIAGSAVTAIVFPGSTACSRAPQTSTFQFTTGNTAILTARNGTSTTTSGFARPSGSFTTDNIPVGSIIGVCGFTQAANNGLFQVTARTATALDARRIDNTGAILPCPGAGCTVLEAGTTGGLVGQLAATPTGYTRTAGSFVADGFVTGMTVNVAGFTQAANNGVATVTGVTAGTLTVTKTPAPVLEAATTGLISMAASSTGTPAVDQYTRSAGSFVADGWVPGMSITAAGFVNPQNNGTSTILAVTAGALTVSKVGGLVSEPEIAATRSISSAASRSVANSTARLIAAERPAISFVWDRRPPRSPDIQ
jgi:hypothetical protein